MRFIGLSYLGSHRKLTTETVSNLLELQQIELSLIDSPARKLRPIDLAVLDEMKNSIREMGLLQPVLLRKKGTRYEVVFGNHRVEAARLARMHKIPAIVKDLDDDSASLYAVSENIQRNLFVDPTVEGEIFDELFDKGWDLTEIARRIGKSPSYVLKRHQIYRNLHPKLLAQLSKKKIPLDMAYGVSMKPLSEQLAVAEKMRKMRQELSSIDTTICTHCPIHCPRK